MLTKKYLIERRPHPLLVDTEQYIYFFPQSYRFRDHGYRGLSIITGSPPNKWEGAILGGMTKEGYGGVLKSDLHLLPHRSKRDAWSLGFKSDKEANEWIDRAIELYGGIDEREKEV